MAIFTPVESRQDHHSSLPDNKGSHVYLFPPIRAPCGNNPPQHNPLERLIQLKRAAGRPKDLEAIAELQALLEERSNKEASS